MNNTPYQPSKFTTKNWAEIKHDLRDTYNINSQIKFKSSMSKSILCDYRILVRETITITEAGHDSNVIQADKINKEVIFKNCTPFTGYIREINNSQVDNAKDFDVVMLLYSLIKYNNNCSKTSVSLW